MTSTSTYSEMRETPDSSRPMGSDAPENNTEIQTASEEELTLERTDKKLLHGARPAGEQVRVAMSQLSLRQIEGHGTRDLSRELGGVLLGEVHRDESGYAVTVRASLPVRSSDHGPVHFTFNADAWSQLHEERMQRYPGLDIVGWYHTHPNLGVFYSADDVVVHQAAFVMPWQVGLVYDPVRGEGCLVGWRQDDGQRDGPKLAGIDGYYELLDEQIGSVVSWQFLRSSVWREGAYRSQDLPRTGQVYTPSNDHLLLPPISPWWGVLLGGLSLLLTLLLIIDRLLAGSP